jgi:hypothetical protein
MDECVKFENIVGALPVENRLVRRCIDNQNFSEARYVEEAGGFMTLFPRKGEEGALCTIQKLGNNIW